jgi:hypothetical protein
LLTRASVRLSGRRAPTLSHCCRVSPAACPIPRRSLIAPAHHAPYPRLSLLSPATPLLPLVRPQPGSRWTSRASRTCYGHALGRLAMLRHAWVGLDGYRCCLHRWCRLPRAPHPPYHQGSVAAHWGLRNCLPTVILLLHDELVSDPCYAVLRPPTHLLGFAESACFKCIYFKCFRYFSGMLQVFYMNVVKVDRDVAYVAMAINVCCKCLF